VPRSMPTALGMAAPEVGGSGKAFLELLRRIEVECGVDNFARAKIERAPDR